MTKKTKDDVLDEAVQLEFGFPIQNCWGHLVDTKTGRKTPIFDDEVWDGLEAYWVEAEEEQEKKADGETERSDAGADSRSDGGVRPRGT